MNHGDIAGMFAIGQQSCHGCVGRGTGTSCCMCGNLVSTVLRRDCESTSEVRRNCEDCQAGRAHTHIGN
jgi:hypothetical protein